MSSKTIWTIIIAIIVLAGGYWYYTSSQSGEMMKGGEAMEQGDKMSDDSKMMQNDPAMVGTWRSTQDPKFTRTFNADGTVTDAYEGQPDATQNGPYTTVDVNTVTDLPVPAASFAGMTVIKVQWPDGPMYFAINSLSGTELTMTYIGGAGGVLSFEKVK